MRSRAWPTWRTRSVTYREWAPLAMAEARLTLRRRVPDEERLAWARKLAAEIGDRRPRTIPEVYALEQIFLHEQPERELKLQAIRIGDLGIAAIPDEVYALTGLKIKAQSPLPATFNIGLANGFEGYIPPAGSTRSAATPPGRHARPRSRSRPSRRSPRPCWACSRRSPASRGASSAMRTALTPGLCSTAKPLAYWRLNEFDGPKARDATGNGRDGDVRGRDRLRAAGAGVAGLLGPGCDQPRPAPRRGPPEGLAGEPGRVVQRRALVLERPARRRSSRHGPPHRAGGRPPGHRRDRGRAGPARLRRRRSDRGRQDQDRPEDLEPCRPESRRQERRRPPQRPGRARASRRDDGGPPGRRGALDRRTGGRPRRLRGEDRRGRRLRPSLIRGRGRRALPGVGPAHPAKAGRRPPEPTPGEARGRNGS